MYILRRLLFPRVFLRVCIRGDDPSICKEGTEVVECPASAVCGVGKILYCNLPFERDDDGERCTLTAAAMEEADIVFKSLR